MSFCNLKDILDVLIVVVGLLHRNTKAAAEA